jgi:hypothetical protein
MLTIRQILMVIFKPIILLILSFLGYAICAFALFSGLYPLILMGLICIMPLMVEIMFEMIIEPYSGFQTIYNYLKNRK